MTAKPAPAGDAPVTLDVSLLGRDYKVTCRETERAQLMDAVVFLDRRMREIRETGKIAGSERIAVMAALNIAHDRCAREVTRGRRKSSPPRRRLTTPPRGVESQRCIPPSIRRWRGTKSCPERPWSGICAEVIVPCSLRCSSRPNSL